MLYFVWPETEALLAEIEQIFRCMRAIRISRAEYDVSDQAEGGVGLECRLEVSDREFCESRGQCSFAFCQRVRVTP
jgi:hypothetical protein